MKLQLVWFVTPLLALSLSACKKKEEAAAPPAGKPTLVEKVVEKAAEIIAPGPKVVALTADERAAKLGFAKHLSPDTEYLISFYNGTKTADRVKASKLWKLVEKQMTGGMGMGMGMGMRMPKRGRRWMSMQPPRQTRRPPTHPGMRVRTNAAPARRAVRWARC